MTSIQLTAKETALMSAVAERFFSFFDEGLTEGSGIWVNTATEEIAGNERYQVSTSARGAASVINSVSRKGLFTQSTDPTDGAWIALTAEGVAWCEEHNANPAATAEAATAPTEPQPATTETPAGTKVQYKGGQEYTVISLSKDRICLRVMDAEGKRTYKRIDGLTVIS